MIKKCLGCGTLMQNEDENREGYVKDITKDYCVRCFRLLHYNETPKVFATNKEFLEVIDYELTKKNLFVYLIDIFSFPISFNKEMIDRLRWKDVILVINKIDLLPKSLNLENILNFIAKECEKIFFKVIGIYLISAKKGYYLTDLLEHLKYYRKERDICILGLASVGKSSFINAILKKYDVSKEDTIATSAIPGTTLNEIHIPFYLDNRGFIDTPGLISSDAIISQIDPKYYNTILPNKEIKPITYQLYGSYSYFIGGLVYLSFTNITKGSLVIYKADELKLTKVKNENITKTLAKVGSTINPSLNQPFKEIVVSGPKTIFIGGFLIIEVSDVKFTLSYPLTLGVKMYDKVFKR